MARKLPWAVSDQPAAKRSRPSPPTRPKETSHDPAHEEDDVLLPPNRGRSSKNSPKVSAATRTPSTSPVRAPPSVEYMRDGYDGDDVFIMVEDEFQSIAQSYTAHLHHAEYKRLKREARTAPKNLPEPTSPMSNEAKRRLQGEVLHKKQNDALDALIGKDPTEQDDDRVGDLFSGTSLAPLMAQSRRPKRSLIGLEKISSTTRAGSGYSRALPQGAPIQDTSDEIRHANNATGDKLRGEDDNVIEDQIPSDGLTTLDKQQATDGSMRRKSKPQALGSDFMKRRREREIRREKEKQSRLNDVPTFIID